MLDIKSHPSSLSSGKCTLKPQAGITIHLPYHLAILLLGIYLREIKSSIYNTCTRIFTAFLFIITQNRKQSRCSTTSEWINKLWYICTVVYSLISKKKEMTIRKLSPPYNMGECQNTLHWMKEGRRKKTVWSWCCHCTQSPRLGLSKNLVYYSCTNYLKSFGEEININRPISMEYNCQRIPPSKAPEFCRKILPNI